MVTASNQDSYHQKNTIPMEELSIKASTCENTLVESNSLREDEWIAPKMTRDREFDIRTYPKEGQL